MILDGVDITVIGMAIVFSLLVILVAAMKGLNIVLKKFFPKSLVEKSVEIEDELLRLSANEDKLAIVAAVVASVKAHITANRD